MSAKMNGIVYQPPSTFRPSCYARSLPIDTCLVSRKFYKSPRTNYVFGVAMGGLVLKLQNFKKVKLIFGHPVALADLKDHVMVEAKQDLTEALVTAKRKLNMYILELTSLSDHASR